MAYTIQFRRGSTSEHTTFTGEQGEVTFDTTTNRLVAHDGTTVSGFAVAKLSDIPTDISHLSDNTSLVTPAWSAKLEKTNKDFKTLMVDKGLLVSSGSAGTPAHVNNMSMSDDGTKMYIAQSQRVFQYNMSIPFDLSTAAYVDNYYYYGEMAVEVEMITISGNGEHLYLGGSTSIQTLDMSTPYDISTASNASKTLQISTYENTIYSMIMNAAGTKMFTTGGNSDEVHQFTLGTPYDITTAVFDDAQFDISNQVTDARSIVMSKTGEKMYIFDAGSDTLYEYDLSTPFDISTTVYNNVQTWIKGAEHATISSDGSKLYTSENRVMVQYSLTSTTDDIVTPTASSDTWKFDITSVISDARTFVGNSDLSFSRDGLNLYTVSDNKTYVNQYQLSSAFDIVTANYIGQWNCKTQLDNQSVNFCQISDDGTKIYMFNPHTSYRYIAQWTLSTPYDITTVDNSSKVKLYVGHLESSITAMNVTEDGKKLIFAGTATDRVYEFVMPSPHDIATAYWTGARTYIGIQDDTPCFIKYSNDGNKLYMGGKTTDALYEYTLTSPFAVATANINNPTIHYFDAPLENLSMSSDGTYTYFRSSSNYQHQYKTDGSTPTAVAVTPSATTWEFTETDFVFDLKTLQFSDMYNSRTSIDGTKLFVMHAQRYLREHTLSTPFDISTATYVQQYDLYYQIGYSNANSIEFAPDGTKFYIASHNDYVYQFTLTNAYDLTSVTQTGNFHVASHLTAPRDLVLSYDGKKMFVLGSSSDKIIEYVMNTSFDVTTAYWAGNEIYVGVQDSNPYSLEISSDGLNLYMHGHSSGNTKLHKYSMTSAYDLSTASYTGAITIPALYYPSFSHDGKYMYGRNETNTGFISQFRVDGSATTAVVATPSVTTWEFTETDFVFDLKTLQFSDMYNSRISIDGTKLFVMHASRYLREHTLSTPFDISTATYVQQYDLYYQIGYSNANSIEFAPDGTKFYISSHNDYVYQFTLATPYDLTSVTQTGNFHVAPHFSAPRDLVLSYDGKKMFVVGTGSDKIVEYIMRTPFDVSTAYWAGNEIYVGTQDANPYSLEISSDGLNLYMHGHSANTNLHKYTMTSAYDLSTASYTGAITIPATYYPSFSHDGKYMYGRNETNTGFISQFRVDGSTTTAVVSTPSATTWEFTETDFVFDLKTQNFTSMYNSRISIDGTKWFVMHASRYLYEHTLSTPFDISTATYVRHYDLYYQIGHSNANSIEFSPAGTKFYISSHNDYVYQFTLTNAYDLTSVTQTGYFHVAPHFSAPRDLVLSYDGKKMFVVGTGSDKIVEYVLTTPFDVSTAYWAGNEIYVGTQDLTPYSLEISSDGLNLYMHGHSARTNLHKYTMTTAYDLSTASYTGAITIPATYYPSFSHDGKYMYGRNETNGSFISQYRVDGSTTTAVVSTPSATTWEFTETDFVFDLKTQNFASMNNSRISIDGTKWFVMHAQRYLYEHTLSTPYDISTATYVQRYDVYPQMGNQYTNSIEFTPDGTKFYIAAHNDYVYQFTLATPYDLTSVTQTGYFHVASHLTLPRDLVLSYDGKKMFVLGSDSDKIVEYIMRTPFDVTTAYWAGNEIYVGTQDTNPTALEISSDGLNLYMHGHGSGNTNLHKYTMTTAYDLSTASYTGPITIPAIYYPSFSHDGKYMYGQNQTNGSFISQYRVDGSATTAVAVTPSATTWELTETDFVFDLKTQNFSSDMQNSRISIDGTKWFVMNGSRYLYEHTLSTPFDISTAGEYVQRYDVYPQMGNQYTNSIEFTPDGTKFYIAAHNDYVYQFTLATPYDLTSVTQTGYFHVASHLTLPRDLVLSYDGKKMFVLGSDSDKIVEYIMRTPFDVTTAYWAGNEIYVGTQDTNPTALEISSDGLNLYMHGHGSGNTNLHKYTMTTAYDLGTASYTGAITVPAIYYPSFSHDGKYMYGQNQTNGSFISQFRVDGSTTTAVVSTPSATAWEFTESIVPVDEQKTLTATDAKNSRISTDGTKFFVMSSYRYLREYTLSTPYDLSTKTYVQQYDVYPQMGNNYTDSIEFTPDGTKFYIASHNDHVYQFTLANAYDLTSVTQTGLFHVGPHFSEPRDLVLSYDGKKMFVVGTGSDKIVEYVLATPFDVTTAYWAGNEIYVGTQDLTPYSLEISSDGLNLYMHGHSANTNLHKYTMTTAYDLSTASYTGPITISASYYPSFSHDGKYMYARASNDSQLVEQYKADTTSTASGSSIDFYAAPWVSTSLSTSNNNFYINDTETLMVATDGSTLRSFTLDSDANLGKMQASTTFSAGSGVTSVALSPTGTEMYVLNTGSSTITQYTLSTPDDISTATSATTFTCPAGIIDFAIPSDGTRVFVMNTTEIKQFNLSTAWSITSAVEVSTNGTFDISNEITTPLSLQLTSSAGTANSKFNVYGENSLGIEELHQYIMGTPNDISTTTYNNDYGIDNLNETHTKAFVSQAGDNIVFRGNDDTYRTYYFDANDVPDMGHTAPTATAGWTADMSLVSYDNITLSVVSQSNYPTGMKFNDNGTKMYMLDSSGVIYEYDLSTAFDLSTSTYNNVSFDSSAQESSTYGFDFNDDGTKLYIVGFSDGKVYQYGLSTAYDLSTIAYSNVFFGISSQASLASDITFNIDGTKMYVVGFGTKDIFQYTLSTGFDVSTASYNSISINVDSIEQSPFSIEFNPDGTKMYMVGNNLDTVQQFSLTSAFDISTATYDNVSFGVSNEEGSPADVIFSTDGSKMYIAGSNGELHQYSTGVVPSATSSIDITVSPIALKKTWEIPMDGYNGLQGFVNGGNKLITTSGTTITAHNMSTPYDITTITGTTSGSASHQRSAPIGRAKLNSDGTKMYLRWGYQPSYGSFRHELQEYDLSTPFDPASLTSVAKITSGWAGSYLHDFDLSYDGTSLYILSNTNIIYQYRLNTPFSISGKYLTGGTFNAGTLDSTPTHLDISNDGTKMFVYGRGDDVTYQLDLSTPYDLSTAVYNGVKSTSFPGATATAISDDGSRVVVQPDNEQRLTLYSMNGDLPVVLTPVAGASNFNGDITASPIALKKTWEISMNAYNGLQSYVDSGNKLITISGASITAHNMSTPYDITTITGSTTGTTSHYRGTELEIAKFNSDGTKMYVRWGYQPSYGNFRHELQEYDLSTPFDPASLTSIRKINSYYQGIYHYIDDFAFSYDSTKMYIMYETNIIYEYVMTTPGSLENIYWTGVTFNVGTLDSTVTRMNISNDGTKMRIYGRGDDVTYQLDLSTPFDLSTISYNNVKSTSFPDATVTVISDDGSRVVVQPDNEQRLTLYSMNGDLPVVLTPAAGASNFNGDITASPIALKKTREISMNAYNGLQGFVDGGNKLITISGASITAHNMSTPYDITTVTSTTTGSTSHYRGTELEIAKLNSDGTKMYVRWGYQPSYGNFRHELQEYDLSTPFDPASLTSVRKINSYYQGIYHYIDDFAFSYDSTKMYIMYETNIIYEYVMVVPGSLENIYWTGVTFNVGTLDSTVTRMNISNDGTKMRIYGRGDDVTYQLDFATPFDLSTISYNDVKSTSFPDATATAISDDGSRVVVQPTNEQRLTLYSMNGDLPVVLTPVAGPASNFNGDITASPIALKKTWEISMNAYNGLQGFVDNGNKLITISGASITAHNMSTPYDITTITSSTTGTTGHYRGAELEIAKFNSDGTKMYVRWGYQPSYGSFRHELQEYDLSTPFDPASFTSIRKINSYYQGIYHYIDDFAFSYDSTKMYIMYETNIIYEYVMTTPGSLDGIYWTGVTFNVGTLDSTPTYLNISNDGTKMRIYGRGDDVTYQLDLSTPFDLSTISYNDVKSTSFPGATATAISDDGSRVVVQPTNEQRLTLYSMNGDLPVVLTPVAGPAWAGDITVPFATTSKTYSSTTMNGGYNGFVDNGNKLITISGASITAHNMSTPYDISTVTSTTTGTTGHYRGAPIERVKFNSDGTKMYVRWGYQPSYGSFRHELQEYDLSIPFDPASFTSIRKISGYYQGIYDYIDDFDFSYDSTKMYIMYDTNIIYEYVMTTPGSLENIYWTGVTFNVGTLDSTPTYLDISNDGTKIFVYGLGGDRTYQLDLSTPFDLSTTVYNGVKSEQRITGYGMWVSDDGNSVSGRITSDTIVTYKIDGTADAVYPTVTTPSGYMSDWNFDFNYIIDQHKNHTSIGTYDHILFISNDGSKLYQSNGNTKVIHQYNLGVAYDVTSKSNSYSTGTFNNLTDNVECMWMSSDGVNMYIGDYDNKLYHYILGTPFDISTAVYTAVNSSVNSITQLRSIEFNPDGIGFNLYYETGQIVKQYICATPWDITTAYWTGTSHVFEGQYTPISFQMSSNGAKVYTYTQEDDTLREYALTTAWDINTISTMPSNSHFFRNTDTIHIAANGSLLTASTGNNYQVYSIDGSAYTPVTATGSSITWAADLQGLTYDTGISYEPSSSTDNFIFSDDGTNMYTSNGGYVTQHTLSTPYDISTASLTHTTNLRDDVGVYNAVTDQIRGMHINSTGTKFYVIDHLNPCSMYQFDFGTPFAISTITATSGTYKRFMRPNQLATITDFTMSYDGKIMLHTSGEYIVERVLATPFDISTEYRTSNTYWLGDLDTSIKSLQFSSDGSALYAFGTEGNSMYELPMTTAYDITTISYAGITKRVPYSTNARLSSDGSKMYVRIGTIFYQYTSD